MVSFFSVSGHVPNEEILAHFLKCRTNIHRKEPFGGLGKYRPNVIQMRATKPNISVILFMMFYKVVIASEPVNEILNFDDTNIHASVLCRSIFR